MTKKQKLDKLLEVVGHLIELTTFDDFIATAEQRSQHYMSDATYEVLEELHNAYRDIDFFDYETKNQPWHSCRSRCHRKENK